MNGHPSERSERVPPVNRHVVQLVVAVLAGVAAALLWPSISTPVDVAPVTEGQPATVSIVYHAPVLLLVWLLATTAGVLVVLGVAGVRRRRTLDAHTP